MFLARGHIPDKGWQAFKRLTMSLLLMRVGKKGAGIVVKVASKVKDAYRRVIINARGGVNDTSAINNASKGIDKIKYYNLMLKAYKGAIINSTCL